ELAEMARGGREPVYLAVATQGVGVVECFLGLLHLTWQSIEQQHSLRGKFGFDGETFVEHVAQKLGRNDTIERILEQRLGVRKEARS
ncbi:MAG TPA: gliding motility protein, partial [Polyangiaceae bacterium]|nr:gliding motility protein [Polyangiaceae bacterium]